MKTFAERVPTGQSYFQQLTAYNNMSAHLRRLVLAPSIVDSRNKKYTRERDKYQQRDERRCSCCFRTRRRNLIEGLAYDTKHHPIDVLRMSLKSNSGCPLKHNNRSSSAPRHSKNRGEQSGRGNKFDRTVEYSQTPASDSPRSNDQSSRRNSSERQYEYHTDSDFDSPINNPNADVAENDKTRDNERFNWQNDEDKYAKFIYDITREIIINGLYTDEELQKIFDKHFRNNYDLLDKDKMQREIDQLRSSLNLTTYCSEDDEENNSRFAVPSASNLSFMRTKPIYKKISKIRENFEESERLKNVIGEENEDSKCDLYIPEKDVILTLMEMKLDPQQIQTIRKSLRNKSKDIVALSKTVQDVKLSNEYKSKDQMNSSILTKSEWRTSRLFRLSDSKIEDNRREKKTYDNSRDQTSFTKDQNCQCRCGQNTEIVDNHQKQESTSSTNVEQEFPKKNDKQIRKNTDENLTQKNTKKIDSASNSTISVISSQKEVSTKKKIDNSLKDISEKSKEKDNEIDDKASNDEKKSNSSEKQINIPQETTTDELASISECSSQSDDVEIVEELMQISEEEETHDDDEISVANHT